MTAETKIIIIEVLFVVTFAFGIWLSNTGKPLNTAIFTVHKLIALAAVVFSAVTIYQLSRGLDLRTIRLGAVIASGLLIVITFASGAWLSIMTKTSPFAVLVAHRIVPVLTALSSGATIYLLGRGE